MKPSPSPRPWTAFSPGFTRDKLRPCPRSQVPLLRSPSLQFSTPLHRVSGSRSQVSSLRSPPSPSLHHSNTPILPNSLRSPPHPLRSRVSALIPPILHPSTIERSEIPSRNAGVTREACRDSITPHPFLNSMPRRESHQRLPRKKVFPP